MIESSEQLLRWLEENSQLLKMDGYEAGLLLGYLDGHGYRLDSNGKELMLVDMQTRNEPEAILIDDVIDRVVEWNYEMICQTREELKKADDASDCLKQREYYGGLWQEERILDSLFDQTCHGKRINELAEKLAMEFIENMQKHEKDAAVGGLVGQIKNSAVEGRGR